MAVILRLVTAVSPNGRTLGSGITVAAREGMALGLTLIKAAAVVVLQAMTAMAAVVAAGLLKPAPGAALAARTVNTWALQPTVALAAVSA
jgi:hypothetical protein